MVFEASAATGAGFDQVFDAVQLVLARLTPKGGKG